jgi:hypothetical protein
MKAVILTRLRKLFRIEKQPKRKLYIFGLFKRELIRLLRKWVKAVELVIEARIRMKTYL